MTTDTTTDETERPKAHRDAAARYFDEVSDFTFDEAQSTGDLEYAIHAGNAAKACRLLDALSPDVLALAERMRADIDAHPLPDGWTALAWSHSGVRVLPADYPHRPSIYVGSIAADDYAWSFQLRDEEPWTTAATLADVVTAYLAADR